MVKSAYELRLVKMLGESGAGEKEERRGNN